MQVFSGLPSGSAGYACMFFLPLSATICCSAIGEFLAIHHILVGFLTLYFGRVKSPLPAYPPDTAGVTA